VLHEPSLEHITTRFKKRNIDLNRLNRDQALVPEVCSVLPNKAGTAPGLWFEKNDTVIVSIPGVPFEMKYFVESEILPRLRKRGKANAIYHKTVQTQGLPESMLAEKIEQWESALPENIKLAYLPNPMSIRLRLSATGGEMIELKEQVEKEIELLKKIIPEHIFGFDNETLSEVIGRKLRKNKKTLAVAESCTGGFISHLITSVPGSSDYFNGGITAYSNAIKQNSLSVSRSSLLDFGAVSEQVAREMVRGAKKLFNADYAVATTGIAGPGGGTDEKPVGTIWIAVAGPNEEIARKYIFGDNRERNIIRSSQTALQLLRLLVQNEI
jgi:nicotinamide-nucleotide amidase